MSMTVIKALLTSLGYQKRFGDDLFSPTFLSSEAGIFLIFTPCLRTKQRIS